MVLVNTDYISGKELGMLGMVKGSTIQCKNIGRDIGASFKKPGWWRDESIYRDDERSKRSGNSPDDRRSRADGRRCSRKRTFCHIRNHSGSS